MARIHGRSARVYVDQFNISGRANTLDLDLSSPAFEVTAFEDSAQEFIDSKSARGWMARLGAFFDGADDQIDEIIAALRQDSGADHHWGFYLDGSAAGSKGYEGVGILTNEGIAIPRGPSRLTFDIQGRDAQFIAEATKLNEATVITGTGAQTGQQHRRTTATSLDKVISIMRVTAVNGAGSVTFRLEESSDNGGGDPYATVHTHTAFTAVGSKMQVTTVAAALGPYYRVNVTAFSGFTNVTLRAAVAVIPGG